MPDRISPSSQFIETAILDAKMMCEALGISMSTLNRLDYLPTVYLGSRSRRYVWRQVLAVLEERARKGL